MRTLTGEDLKKTLGWWIVLTAFASLFALTYIRTLDLSPHGTVVTQPLATYDFVIVGGGVAGSVLAARLSENPSLKILVLEAGGEETGNIWYHVPLTAFVTHATDADWKYQTVQQKHACFAAKEQRCNLARGKILGGSGMTNNMVYSRGSRDDYETWANLSSSAWNFENILPYFLKSEDMRIEQFKKSEYHSTGGLLSVSDTSVVEPKLSEAFLEAGKELGYNTTDCNGKADIGFCLMQSTVDDGHRGSTVNYFLRPAMSRPNLHVIIHSVVTKILIQNKRAVGVEYLRNGRKQTVGATREVILSAGPVESPHILILSGIGPRLHLQHFKIPIHADLPVGENLQDHMIFSLRIAANQSTSITADKAFSLLSQMKYFLFSNGVLGSNAGLIASAFMKTDPRSRIGKPDVELTLKAIMNEQELKDFFKESSAMGQAWNTIEETDGFTISVKLLNPKSRGTVQLRSSSPLDMPLIDPIYLKEQDDINTFIRGIKVALSLLNTKPFRKMKARLADKPYPSCIQHRMYSDAYWTCLLRHHAVSSNQPTSTCRLGPFKGSDSVLDPQLRVKGIPNLRVVDESVMPTTVSGDTYAATVMIGEKAADMIRGKNTVEKFRKQIKKLKLVS
ncbi:hypothetical protein CHS0354_023507 [Potamilus streckersoni]|uniref:Glucose-methanol-choline oxidoreductase N-terminal domain-containing protein n=1 Tax=Potamilus streckersoni TaxID=2493646 RepID=A0AAE0RVV4_9BIVA|nr:hypothetical protein CHS0354_023507 [Potamilus streckersoni]